MLAAARADGSATRPLSYAIIPIQCSTDPHGIHDKHMKTRTVVLYLILLTGVLTYVLYRYHASQPPDQAQFVYCNELVKDMPESTQEEINRSINTFLECLQN